MNKVIVIGTGYVGLPLAIMLAKHGYEVVGVDIKKSIELFLQKNFYLHPKRPQCSS